MSKENRGGGQKMDQKRIWVTQPQLRRAGRSSACGKEQRMPFFLHSKRRLKVPPPCTPTTPPPPVNTFPNRGLASASLPSWNKEVDRKQAELLFQAIPLPQFLLFIGSLGGGACLNILTYYCVAGTCVEVRG